MTTPTGYVICPNAWAKVYHLAEQEEGRPGLVRALCGYGGGSIPTTGALETWKDSAAYQPVYVATAPADRRLCRACALRAKSGA